MLNDDQALPELNPEMDKSHKHSVISRFVRFITWWLILSGIYASSSVCPFCGKLGCPVGGASAGIVGAFLALVVARGKAFLNYLSRVWHRIGSKLKLHKDKIIK